MINDYKKYILVLSILAIGIFINNAIAMNNGNNGYVTIGRYDDEHFWVRELATEKIYLSDGTNRYLYDGKMRAVLKNLPRPGSYEHWSINFSKKLHRNNYSPEKTFDILFEQEYQRAERNNREPNSKRICDFINMNYHYRLPDEKTDGYTRKKLHDVFDEKYKEIKTEITRDDLTRDEKMKLWQKQETAEFLRDSFETVY